MTTTIAFTGHRPKDLGDKHYMDFRDALDALGVGKRHDLRFVVGGALGVDRWAATYALLHNIPYTLILPFQPSVMTQHWTEADRENLRTQINAAADVHVIHKDGYDVRAYQQRNEAMVNLANVVFAVWTGKVWGGTANCIHYALKQDVPTYNLWPLDGKLRPIKSI